MSRLCALTLLCGLAGGCSALFESACPEPADGCERVECAEGCFQLCDTLSAVPQAEIDCEQRGGTLAQADTGPKNSCLAAALAPDTLAWIGLRQQTDSPTPADGWFWPDDQPLGDEPLWSAGAPQDSQNGEANVQNCAFLREDRTWDDESCSFEAAYFCSF